MSLNNAFPQIGIIMSIQNQAASVFIPLAKYETGYLQTTVILDPDMVGAEVVVTFINGDRNQGIITGVIRQ